MCVGQRGGGHGRITEYAGHIIHQSTWHTVFGGECWELENRTEMTILVCIAVQAAVQLRVTNAASMKAQWAHAAPALYTHRFCAASALLAHPV